MNTLLRQGVIIGLFAILFTPLIVVNEFFFPFITGKAFFFRILVEIVFALYVVLALRDASVRPKKSALLFAIGGFVAWLGIGTVLAENPSKALWSNFERMEGYITVLHLAAYFVVLSSVATTEKLWTKFFATSVIVSALVGIYGVLQLSGALTINQGGVRVDATFGNATYLAVYMLFHVFLTLFLFATRRLNKFVQVLLGVALVLQTLMVFYTATRGTILGLVGGLFVSGLIFALFQKENQMLRRAGVALVAGVLVVSGAFFAARDTAFVQGNEVLSRIASISLEEGKTRFAIWGMAWQGFLERPVFGWGQEGFNYVFNKYYSPSLYAQEPWFDRAHNVFFDWLIAGGLPGLALYLSFFALAFWYLWKPGSVFAVPERALFTGLLAGYGFHNLFVFDNLMSYVLFFSVLAYLVSRDRASASPWSEKEFSASTTQTAGVVAALLFVAVFYFANIPGIARSVGIINAIKPYQDGVTKNFEMFKNVIGPSGVGRQEAHEQLIQFSTQIRSQQLASASTDQFKNEVTLFARDAFAAEVARTPNDARLQVFYGSYLRQIGDLAGGEVALARARELSPNKQSIIFEQGIVALNQGNNAEAVTFFKEAYELEPRYDRARVLYAAALLRTGNSEAGEALLIERYGTITPNEDVILQTYVELGMTERVVAIAEGKVAAEPKNFQHRLQLAAAYLQNGDRVRSVEALREAIRLNPDFAVQGEYYIGEIEAGRNP